MSCRKDLMPCLLPAYQFAADEGLTLSARTRAAGEIADISLVLRDRAEGAGLDRLVGLLNLAHAEALENGRAPAVEGNSGGLASDRRSRSRNHK